MILSVVRSAISGPVGALLEQTTLGEFMAAVESVRRKSHLELPLDRKDPSSRGVRQSSPP